MLLTLLKRTFKYTRKTRTFTGPYSNGENPRGQLWYRRKFCEETLCHKLQSNVIIDLYTRLIIASKILRKLNFWQENNILHGHLVLKNIFISKDGVVEFLDAGIALARVHAKVDLGVLDSLSDYSALLFAPEVFSADFDVRADLYSLGCMLRELLFGSPGQKQGLEELELSINELCDENSGKRPELRFLITLVDSAIGEIEQLSDKDPKIGSKEQFEEESDSSSVEDIRGQVFEITQFGLEGETEELPQREVGVDEHEVHVPESLCKDVVESSSELEENTTEPSSQISNMDEDGSAIGDERRKFKPRSARDLKREKKRQKEHLEAEIVKKKKEALKRKVRPTLEADTSTYKPESEQKELEQEIPEQVQKKEDLPPVIVSPVSPKGADVEGWPDKSKEVELESADALHEEAFVKGLPLERRSVFSAPFYGLVAVVIALFAVLIFLIKSRPTVENSPIVASVSSEHLEQLWTSGRPSRIERVAQIAVDKSNNSSLAALEVIVNHSVRSHLREQGIVSRRDFYSELVAIGARFDWEKELSEDDLRVLVYLATMNQENLSKPELLLILLSGTQGLFMQLQQLRRLRNLKLWIVFPAFILTRLPGELGIAIKDIIGEDHSIKISDPRIMRFANIEALKRPWKQLIGKLHPFVNLSPKNHLQALARVAYENQRLQSALIAFLSEDQYKIDAPEYNWGRSSKIISESAIWKNIGPSERIALVSGLVPSAKMKFSAHQLFEMLLHPSVDIRAYGARQFLAISKDVKFIYPGAVSVWSYASQKSIELPGIMLATLVKMLKTQLTNDAQLVATSNSLIKQGAPLELILKLLLANSGEEKELASDEVICNFLKTLVIDGKWMPQEDIFEGLSTHPHYKARRLAYYAAFKTYSERDYQRGLEFLKKRSSTRKPRFQYPTY